MGRKWPTSCFSPWLWDQVPVALTSVHFHITAVQGNLFLCQETPVMEKQQYKYFIISATAALCLLCWILRDSKTHNHFPLLQFVAKTSLQSNTKALQNAGGEIMTPTFRCLQPCVPCFLLPGVLLRYPPRVWQGEESLELWVSLTWCSLWCCGCWRERAAGGKGPLTTHQGRWIS